MNIVMMWYQHDWGLYGRRYEMIARTWVKEKAQDQLVVVEPPLNPWIWLREIVPAVKARDSVLVLYWLSTLRRLFSPLVQENERLWVLQPFFWWPFRSWGNSRWTRFSFSKGWETIDRFLRDHAWEEALLWAYPPHAFVRYAVERWKKGRICVDLVDDNSQYQVLPDKLRDEYRTCYRDFLDKADVIFSVSPVLANQLSSPKKQVIHIPNAASPTSRHVKPWRLPPIPAGIRVCYVGRLDERLNFALLKQIFGRLPRVQFILIGSFENGTKAIWGREFDHFHNVHLFGTIPNAHIPSVLALMDCCMLPHVKTPLTESMDPLKLYAYIAAGKPVISTGINIESSLKPWVKFVDSADAFELALSEVQNPAAPVAPPDLSSYAWPKRVAAMAGYLG